MTMRMVLYGRVPSKKNSKRRIQRGSHIFMVPSQAHEDWHREQMALLGGGYSGRKPIEEVDHITLTFFAADRRAGDLSNKAESVMDLLVDAGILKDDNWFVVPKLVLNMGGVDKAQPRVEVMLELKDDGVEKSSDVHVSSLHKATAR